MDPPTSKRSKKARTVVMAFLALWSIVSLIVIVVWATSPDMKGSAQCRAELKDTNAQLEGTKVMMKKKEEELVELMEAKNKEWENQRAEILLLLGRLNATNATLEACREEMVSGALFQPCDCAEDQLLHVIQASPFCHQSSEKLCESCEHMNVCVAARM